MTNFSGLLIDANAASGDFFAPSIPVVVMVIVYANLSIYGFHKAMSSAAFIGYLSALPLFAMGLISEAIMIVFLILLLIFASLDLMRK